MIPTMASFVFPTVALSVRDGAILSRETMRTKRIQLEVAWRASLALRYNERGGANSQLWKLWASGTSCDRTKLDSYLVAALSFNKLQLQHILIPI
jgi:hypothetical protein